jgi:4-hydroxybenzoate polyprenyltransferase
LPPQGFGVDLSLVFSENADDRTGVQRTPILFGMQTRYLLVASLLTGLAILMATAIWMATRL